MLQLHTDKLDRDQLENRLESLLDQGFRRVPEHPLPHDPAQSAVLHRGAGRWAWFRRIQGGLGAWRSSGWSPRWLVLRTPVIGPFAWAAWGKLTLRAFRQHTLTKLGQLEIALEQSQADKRQLQARLEQETQTLRVEFALASERIQRLGQGIHRLERRAASAVQSESDIFADWYLALENTCRGDTADIESRLVRYLPYLQCAQVGQPGWPVLDLGCGRGEWLKLLGRHHFEARGIDSNPAMLGEARQQHLDVVESDLIAFLRAAAPESIGAVTAFQVVEHLDQDTLLELFQQARRVLRPGGVLLLETPNPENLQVAAYSFWLDPTHVRPIPPPLLAHSAAYFGFIDIRIERSNAWSDVLRLDDASEAARHLEKLLFSGQDYALIARKPYAEETAPVLSAS